MDKDTHMYRLDNVYRDTRQGKCSSIGCEGRTNTGNIEGEGPVESVFVTGTHPHPPSRMKHKLCEAKIELKNFKSKQCAFGSDNVCTVVQN